MTIDEYKALSPKDKNALVAEKVMGWVWSEQFGCWTKDGEPLGYVFSPIENISAAWQVVEHFRRKDIEVKIEGLGSWDVSIGPYFDEGIANEWWDRAPTAPEAICLAALRANGVVE